jgi:3-dehydroquinate synthase
MKIFPSSTGDVCVGRLHEGLPAALAQLHASSVLVVADDNTAVHCLPLLGPWIDQTKVVIIPHGETHKTLEGCQRIWSALVDIGADRASVVLNVGGGMICDLGGFAAACYQRGIRFAHIPTSLLAMADAAMGGKTGVNYEGFKNYLGRFEAPAFIWVDPVFLQTLPQREILDGMAEIVKHAIIRSQTLWDLVSITDFNENTDWTGILEENTPVKLDIAGADPLEKGIRKTLNFGHTIGHALESHYLHTPDPLSHGQAITLGMLAESRIALLMGLLGNEDFQCIIALIKRLLSPSEVTLPSLGEIKPWLQGDKKKSGGRVGFSLPDRIGSCTWDVGVDDRLVAESLIWVETQVSTVPQR